MSLVSEALRKARQEARLRDAAGRGIPIEIVTRHVGSGRGPGMVVAALAVVVAGLGGAGLTWWLLDHRGEAAPQAAAGSATEMAVPERTHRQAIPAESPAASPAEPPAQAAPASSLHVETAVLPRPAAQQGAAAPRGAEVTVQDAARIEGTAAPTPPAGPQASAPAQAGNSGTVGRDATNPAGERSFKIQATLRGVTLHLDYIVHRATAPFAGINGEQVLTGSIIAGFKVEEITPDSIRLSGPGGIVVLRAR